MSSYPDYWKQEISKSIGFLFEKTEQSRWPYPSIIAVERNVILASFGVRKLFEANFILAKEYHAKIPIIRYPKKISEDRTIASMQVERLYNLSKVQQFEEKLSFVCNQLIHSHVLRVVLTGYGVKGLAGVLFNSDRSRKDSVYFLHINDFIRTLSPICGSYFGRTRFHVSPDGILTPVKDLSAD